TPGAGCTRSFTVDHTKVSNDQTNFTVLVSVTNVSLKLLANGGKVSGQNDIQFYADAGITTRLKWEIEKYDGVAGTLIAWVKIPSLSSTVDTVFYLFYGSGNGTDNSDKTNTWDTNFKGVWHMADNASNTTIAGSIGPNGTNVANTSGKSVSGEIGSALNYNGTTDGSNMPLSMAGVTLYTVS